jgi:MFS family permease
MALIDRLGRKPLLIIGAIGITLSLSIAGMAFKNATYTLKSENIAKIEKAVLENEKYKDQAPVIASALNQMVDKEYKSETSFFKEVREKVGAANYNNFKELILRNSIAINSILVLIGLMCYVASFAISLGPVMWALLSEIFPNKLRGLAISVVGLWNSVVSFSVATIFPAELEHLGSGTTYFIYAIFGFLTLLFVLKYVPETKGKSLEELEASLVK